jgi:hypothetical protein
LRSVNIADLDDLALLCRDGDSKSMLEEAIQCYRSGAFRACIVVTWLATVYDIMSKLRELAASGDAEATKKVTEMDTIVVTHDMNKSLEFERQILTVARDSFELISQSEFVDLSRILEDRHRCAHPSLNRPGEVYRPTAETARVHLRVATEHLLSQGPVQGKAALTRVLSEIESQLFPTDAIHATQVLRLGAMGRPKEVLLRNVAFALVSSLLIEDKEWRQKVAALLALRTLHRARVESFIEKRFAEKAASVSEDGLWRIIRFVRWVADTWQYLPDVIGRKLIVYVAKVEVKNYPQALLEALSVPELSVPCLNRFQTLVASEVAGLIEVAQPQAVIDCAIRVYAQATGYIEANALKLQLLDPIVPVMKTDDVVQLVRAASKNPEVIKSYRFGHLLTKLRKIPSLDFTKVDSEISTLPSLAGFLPLPDPASAAGSSPSLEEA